MPNSRRSRSVAASALSLSLLLTVAACSSTDSTSSTAAKASTSATVSAIPGDGTLTIAALLPGTGESAEYAASTEAGVQLAVRDIENSGIGPTVSLSTSNVAAVLASGSNVSFEGTDAVVVPFTSVAASTGVVWATLSSTTGATPSDSFVTRLKSVSPRLSDTAFAAESYDAVVAIAIAEVIAGSDSASALGSALPSLAAGGYTCTSFGDCATAIKAGQSITYQGQSGTATVSGSIVTIGALSIAPAAS